MSINYISLKFRIKFSERNEGGEKEERGKEREREKYNCCTEALYDPMLQIIQNQL